MPMRPSSVRITGSWNAMPKAKISDIISDRYSPTLGSSAISAWPSPRGLLHAEREPHQHRHHQEIDQHRAEHEEDRRRDEIWQERLPLVAVEPGRHEHVDLRGDDREREERRAEQRELELGEEIFQQRGVDELGVLRARHPDERPDQHVVDRLGEEEAAMNGDGERQQRLDQPRAQLDQVRPSAGALLASISFSSSSLLTCRSRP